MSNEQNINNDTGNRGSQGNFSGEVNIIAEAARTHPDDPQRLTAAHQLFAQMPIDTMLPTSRRGGAGWTQASPRSSEP